MHDDAFNLAMLILRVGLGVVFLAHGIKHARGREKTTNWFAWLGLQTSAHSNGSCQRPPRSAPACC